MKKLFVILSTVLVLTATGAQIAEGLIEKLLRFSVKELIVERVFSEVWKSTKLWSMRPGGHQLYHSARSVTYDNLGVRYENWESYLHGRTIVVARIKGYFFNGENLRDTYLAIKPRFKEEFLKLSDKEKEGLHQTLSQAKTCFELMLKKEHQFAYKMWLRDSAISDSELSQIWIENNLPAEDIAKRIRAGELKKTPDHWDVEDAVFKAFPDKDMAKFAGRRLRDGGEELLRRYIEVIDLALADAK